MPQEEYFSQALYTFDIGQNDFTAGLFANTPIEKINASVPDLINSLVYNIEVAFIWEMLCYSLLYLHIDDHICIQNRVG